MGSVMLTHHGRRILLQLPFRHPADGTDLKKPLIPHPAGGPAVFGIMNNKPSIAMGQYLGLLPPPVHALNSMQGPVTGGPELDLVHKIEEVNVFTIIAFLFL